MKYLRRLSAFLVAAAVLVLTPVAYAQDYPDRLVRIVLGYPPASGLDSMARLLADKLRVTWGQPVIVENRPGAGGNIGADHVAKSSPDGYTLMLSPPGPLVINKSLYSKLTYDPDAFAPISLVTISPIVLVVHPKVEATNVQQLIAHAKANPGRLNYASSGVGGTQHLSMELFKSMAGLDIVNVPYKGTGAATTDLLSGQVDMLISEITTVLPHIRTGKLRALAVGAEKRNALLPDVPAMTEVLPGYFAASWNGMVAPAGTPPAIIDKVSLALAKSLKSPEILKRSRDTSVELIGSTPAEMAEFMSRERERWANLIRITGAKAN
jgi:tripartite-type tricarboxylate transporter receptor subunit TctC